MNLSDPLIGLFFARLMIVGSLCTPFILAFKWQVLRARMRKIEGKIYLGIWIFGLALSLTGLTRWNDRHVLEPIGWLCVYTTCGPSNWLTDPERPSTYRLMVAWFRHPRPGYRLEGFQAFFVVAFALVTRNQWAEGILSLVLALLFLSSAERFRKIDKRIFIALNLLGTFPLIVRATLVAPGLISFNHYALRDFALTAVVSLLTYAVRDYVTFLKGPIYREDALLLAAAVIIPIIR